MLLTRSLMAILLGAALGLAGCNAPGMSTDVYPTPRPQDLPVGLDEGLITRDWDGGHPVRWFAFFLNPIGVAGDLLVNQPFYLLATQEPELFGYTNQDNLYRQRFPKSQYSWDTFYYQHQQYEDAKKAREAQSPPPPAP
ncbi:MAG: hypothetical protein EPO02_02370 [Nitrospirae bacterium]|nr:MAG: hypothetical protein EPO02_02370 [Nitrospirota bacterium]